MTTKQLKKLPHGTKVLWRRGDELCNGYVVDLRKSRPSAEPPLVYIQWEDMQRTDAGDESALQYVAVGSIPQVMTA